MQIEVVVFLLFLFSGVWSVPYLLGIAKGLCLIFCITLLSGSSFFLSRCIEEGKRVCFTFFLLNCSFALWYDLFEERRARTGALAGPPLSMLREYAHELGY